MARALWSGFLSFGLVNVPVGLYAATRDQTIHFHQLHKATSNRIRYKKVDEETGAEVGAEDLVNGFDVGGGEYVLVEKEELRKVAPGRSEMVEITDFVELSDIDPMYFQQTYYLAPRGKGADRAYLLLLRAMAESNKVGIGTLVLREREHLVAVRPGTDALLLETMYFADEVRDARSVLETLPRHVGFKARELTIAKQLIDSLSVAWSPGEYHNTYRARVEDLIKQKRAGNAVVFDEPAPKSNVIDLMAALEASVTRASGRGRGRAGAAGGEERGTDTAKAEQTRFEGLNRTELLRLAADLELRGRSKMSKVEPVRALSSAAPTKQRQRRAS